MARIPKNVELASPAEYLSLMDHFKKKVSKMDQPPGIIDGDGYGDFEPWSDYREEMDQLFAAMNELFLFYVENNPKAGK